MTERDSRLQRLHELLADRATQGLAPPESQELETLRREFPGVDTGALDRCAAAIDLALQWDLEPLPESLHEKLLEDGASWMAARKGRAIGPALRRRLVQFVPWFAAAAGLLLAVLTWWTMRQAPADPAARRNALLAEAPDARLVPWQAPNDAKVSGDVVWSNQRQEGYLRFEGLAVNDPSAIQYQLWIFDARRQGLNAVSGGVFDVPAAGEVIVPIDAGVKVFEPSLFAVTTEPPGGVVQHDPNLDPGKYRIILTAPPQS